jgi:hypothetical protein
VLNTQTNEQSRPPTLEELRAKVEELGFVMNLQPIYDVYAQYRFGAFDAFAAVLWLLPSFLASVSLLWWIREVKRQAIE